MSSERYLVPDDLDALRRENELLTLENNYLKVRLAELEHKLAQFPEVESEATGPFGRGSEPYPAPSAEEVVTDDGE